MGDNRQTAKKLKITYDVFPPSQQTVCKSASDALKLLKDVKATLEDDHAVANIEAVEKWVKNV